MFRHGLKYLGQLIPERGRALHTTSGMWFLNVLGVIARFRAQVFKGENWENNTELVFALKEKRPVGTLPYQDSLFTDGSQAFILIPVHNFVFFSFFSSKVSSIIFPNQLWKAQNKMMWQRFMHLRNQPPAVTSKLRKYFFLFRLFLGNFYVN